MDWLARWWSVEVVHGVKGPLLLSFVAFVVTFLTTRTITRLIRAGKGPFHNLSNGGVHLHHSTPGVILLVAGGFSSVGAQGRSPLNYIGAALVGIGASLVLDEFAMIFHLQDVYWSQEGQLSVNVVTLAAACVGLGVVGVSPESATGLSDQATAVRGGVAAGLGVHLVLVVVTALKGKYPMALLAIFLVPLSVVGAVRMARPTSIWARRFYDVHRTAAAARRAQHEDRRWGPVRQRWDDLIGGAPSAS
ncbi:hypothetical protein G9U51_12915 [Calidifontibacter sp. DB0510]|uniref:Integral membrane protein n=1 Tax=Metallococcus carri TaxID=1656884 RepID=A0A967B363_9MICO|nr:hypothetical protein [Metallococcus carri]NHN56683.1 hypothetical protein [Metallococcus carri]NOP38982.1 hypothetical protein [Calidifontibacter sp. DB2511S]